ncbi:hypothetical protein F4778DRAFT_793540 [Xylariomycetidae sp. FL2044]|nr:hypothetical protein F4778DRAFT_793540 [Xylariomycetidae sp. FL2044]
MSFPVINGTEVMLPPPDNWGAVDFDNPHYNYGTRTAIYWAFGWEYPLATLFLAQRMYTSFFILPRFRVDDVMILISWAIVTAACALMLFMVGNQYVGLHAWEQSLERSIYMTKLILALTLCAIVSTVLAKLTLCVFYYRLAPQTWYRHGIIGTGILCIVCFGSVFFVVLFACHPIEASWDLRVSGRCISLPPWYLLQAVAGGVTDLLLMLQAIPIVLGLNMSPKHKAAVIAWFCIGFVTLAAAIMRLVSLLSMLSSANTPWTMAEAMLWLKSTDHECRVVESNLIVLCGCLPTLRIFLTHIFPDKKTKSPSYGSSGYNGRVQNEDSRGQKNYALRTIGGSRMPGHHGSTITDVEQADEFVTSHGAPRKSGRRGIGATWISDTGSSEAILDTMTKDLPDRR